MTPHIYPVNAVYATIQGEGCMTGTPIVVIRLQGCNMRCSWCDTKYTWPLDIAYEVAGPLADDLSYVSTNHRLFTRIHASRIAACARQIAPNLRWALITGGEPAVYDLIELAAELFDHSFKVALETNGTCEGHLDADIDWVCVSPKLTVEGPPVHQHVLARADEIKFVVTQESDIERIKNFLAPFRESFILGTICIQPVSGASAMTELCVKTAMAEDWRLSMRCTRP